MEYTLEQTIEHFLTEGDIRPFKAAVIDKIISIFIKKYGKWYVESKYPDLDLNDYQAVIERAFADVYIKLHESSFFYTYKDKRNNLEGYIYSILKNIFSDDGYVRLRNRIVDILNENRDLFWFWILKKEQRVINDEQGEERFRSYFHSRYKNDPPPQYTGNLKDDDPVDMPGFHRYIGYLKRERLLDWLKNIFLKTKKSFPSKMITDYFYHKYYKNAVEISYSGENEFELDKNNLQDGLSPANGNDVTEVFSDDEEELLHFFDELIDDLSLKMAEYVYWFALALLKNEKETKVDIFRKAEELSKGKVKRNSVENNIKNNANSFSRIFNSKYSSYFGDKNDEADYHDVLFRFLEYFCDQRDANRLIY